MTKRLFLALLTGLVLAAPAVRAADDMNPQTRAKAQQARRRRPQVPQEQAGAQRLRRELGRAHGAVRCARFWRTPPASPTPTRRRSSAPRHSSLSKANPDGSIVEIKHDESYNTAVAITALALTKDPKYAPLIASGQKYITKHQVDEDRGFMPVDNWYGGIGYGGDERPDLSNLYIALESLRKTSLDPKDPVWQKALVFVNRMQNRSESNDQK